jgi:NAD+ synthase (glutamine-hydrolysing)
MHSWECLAEILKSDVATGIICDIGMAVMYADILHTTNEQRHKNVRYNCRVFILDHKIILIRPKKVLADDGNYRESRWFVPWKQHLKTEEYYLPRSISKITGQHKVPFGDAAIATRDTSLAAETCEELFAPMSPHIYLGLNGIEIVTNGSGSHHQLRKLYQRVRILRSMFRSN